MVDYMPNRDRKNLYRWMYFCSEKGSGELISCANGTSQIDKIHNQVVNYFNSYKSLRADKFIAYFQNFTNTYDSIKNLKAKYDAALINPKIVGLEVATRPDCINEDIVKLLSSYKDKYYVCVELGLQTSNDDIGNFINRGYLSSSFTYATKLLNKYGIDIVVHLMIGLPLETFNDVKIVLILLTIIMFKELKFTLLMLLKILVWLICIIQENMFQFLLTIIWIAWFMF